MVVGAGQCGLAASHLLRRHGVDHLVLERGEVANMWSTLKWRAFRLVTQNWQCRLPGPGLPPGDPGDFMDAPTLRGYLQGYAESQAGEVRCGVEVRRLEPLPGGGYHLHTSAGALEAQNVIVATGAFHAPRLPGVASGLDPEITQLHSMEYLASAELPPGGVMVVGSGQSGWQVARELHLEGRPVFWSLGRGAMLPRRYRGKDIFRWLEALGLLEVSREQHPGGDRVRTEPRPFFYDVVEGTPADPRALAAQGLTLLGRLEALQGSQARFSADRDSRLRGLDQSSLAITELVDTFIQLHELQAPPAGRVVSSHRPAAALGELDLREQGINSVIWATGYRTRWHRWIRAEVFDEQGYPRVERGISRLPGLYFVGLTWMHGWGSGLLYGVAEDVAYVVEHLVGPGGGGGA
mgnify:CR=1 FL=1